MLKQIITEEYQLSGIVPVTGSVHQWSPEIKKEIRKKFPVFSRFSKLLIALSQGVTSYFMLYGYTKGSLKPKIVGKLESAGSHVLGRFQDERQEDYINARCGVIGARLHRFIKNKEVNTFALDKKYIEEDFYMNLDEDFTKRLEKAKKEKSL